MKKVLFVSFLSCLTLYSCKKEEPQPTPVSNYKTAYVTHFGFDFSAGKMDSIDYMKNDGEIIAWEPVNGSMNYPTHLWYRNSGVDQNGYLNQYKKMAGMTLESIKSVPSEWDTNFQHLQVGDVIVAKCHDGNVKFKVLDLDTTNWSIQVKYLFVTGNTFSE